MKRAARRRTVLPFLLAMSLAITVQAGLQAPAQPAPQAAAAISVWDWLENALTATPVAAPLTVADSPILGLWVLKSVEGTPSPAAVVRQYASHPDGLLAMAEFTIDEHTVPRFRVYSAKAGVSSAQYTDESFGRFLLNGSRTTETVSFQLVDRNTLSEMVSAGATPGRRNTLSISVDGATLTEVTEKLDSAGVPGARETRVFRKQSGDIIRAAELASPALAQQSNTSLKPPNPLLGTWKLNEAKSTTKPEADSLTLHRFIDLGKGAFGTLLVRLSRAGAPSLEMAAVKFEGPDELVLALPLYTLPQVQIFLERDTLPASAVAFKMIDARTVETTAKSLANGKISAITTRRFSEDFAEFTETRKAFDAQGKQTGETITVYSKVSMN